MFPLPPYFPELNRSEYFKDGLRREIQRGAPSKDVTDLKWMMSRHSRRIQRAPDRVRAYAKPHHINYAAYVACDFVGSIKTLQHWRPTLGVMP